jgi:hypothetical protein
LPSWGQEIHSITGTIVSISGNSITVHQLPDTLSPFVFKNAADKIITITPDTTLYQVNPIGSTNPAQPFQKEPITVAQLLLNEKIFVTSSTDMRSNEPIPATLVYRLVTD